MNTQVKKLLAIVALAIGLVGLARADLAKQIDTIINQPSQKNVRFSIRIVNAASGQTLYSHNPNTPMVPASNMKIVVTAAALKYLGPDYRYETKVGLCDDTLVVIGSGDPLLGDEKTDLKYGRKPGWIFEDIAQKLKNNNITTIKDIILDTSIFDDQRVHPNWPKAQLNQWYACEVSGLNCNDNCIDITVKNIGGKVDVIFQPKTDFIKLINKVVPTSGGRTAISAYRNQEPNKIILSGKCTRRHGPFSIAIERPAAFFGFLLAENLIRAGINTEGRLIEKTVDPNCNFKQLAQYNTSIADCLSRSNKNSLGLAAEALLKTIAVTDLPHAKNGSWAQGQKAIARYLTDIGIPEEQFHIDDGSGLSRQNKLSANAVTEVLLNVYKTDNWQLYKSSLAAGGVDGTIAKYFKEQKYTGKIFGKTGYISGVKSFSGLCSTSGGDYVFSILANNTNGLTRPAINNIAKAIFD